MAVLYGIGVGPGDPELITVKALEIIKRIDVLLVPVSGCEKKSIAYETVKGYLTEKTKVEQLFFPMSQDSALYEEAGRKAAFIIQNNIEQEKNCAFITIGDPSLYSTFGYIAKALPNNIQTVIVPGVPSFCAAAAAAKMMLAEKDDILSIIPLTAEEGRAAKAANAADHIVYLKVYRNIHKAEELLREQNYCVVANCGLENEWVGHNGNLREEAITYLTTILAER